jgi:hypothetical protein
MLKRCETCKWWNELYPEPNDPLEDRLGNCEWPAELLPYSLRYGNRERTGVYGHEGTLCPQWISNDNN